MTALAPRPGILEIAPYVGGEAKLPGIAKPIKLASNESALGPSPRAVEAFREAARSLQDDIDAARLPVARVKLLERVRTALARRWARISWVRVSRVAGTSDAARGSA